MRKYGVFIIAVLVVAAAIVASLLVPVTRPEPQTISLPVSRMLTCPVVAPDQGKTVVSVADQETFVAGELNALPSDPQTSASLENPSKPVIVRGSATVSGVSVFTKTDNGTDHTMAVPCTPPITTGVWNGVSTTSSSALVFTNVDTSSAVMDVFLYSETGPIAQLGLRDISLAPGVTHVLPIDSGLVSSDTPVSVQIRASKGRVAAVLRTMGDQGYDWQLPQTSADTDLLIAGIPAGDGARTLSIANNDPTNKAVITVEVIGESGSFAPLGLETIEIAASRVSTVDITQALGGQASAVHLTSDRPVTATVVMSGDDMAGISAQPGLNGAAVLPGLGGTLWVANPGDQDTTLTVDSDDGSNDFPIIAHTIMSVPFPSAGTVKISTESEVLRTSLVLTDSGLSILPISGGGIVTSVPAPRVAPGLG